MRRSPWSAATIPVARDLLDRTDRRSAHARNAGSSCRRVSPTARASPRCRATSSFRSQCSHEALELSTDPLGRERILANIALTFAQMGLREAARDAGLLVVATAQDRTTRLTATINLMELAYLDGRELVFEQYRRELSRETMTPNVEVSFLQTSAEGLRDVRSDREAQRAAERMLDVASRHELHEHVMRAGVAARRGRAAAGAGSGRSARCRARAWRASRARSRRCASRRGCPTDCAGAPPTPPQQRPSLEIQPDRHSAELNASFEDVPGASCERWGAVDGSAQAASADVANVTTARVSERRVIGVPPARKEMAPPSAGRSPSLSARQPQPFAAHKHLSLIRGAAPARLFRCSAGHSQAPRLRSAAHSADSHAKLVGARCLPVRAGASRSRPGRSWSSRPRSGRSSASCTSTSGT